MHVLIVGAGFGGLWTARALRDAPVDVTLLDRRNHHLFQPLLYQVATAALNPSDIAEPIRSIVRRHKNVTVLLGEAVRVDLPGGHVQLADGASLSYDFLVLATGATHSYFGRDDWSIHAPGLKTIEDALEIRRRVFLAYEAAERETDDERRRAWLTFVVIGAGPTGVEMAGALAEIARHAMAREFRRIDPQQSRIVLVEGQDRVLPPYPAALSRKARLHLEALGVIVRTGARVTHLDRESVMLGAERIACRTVVWAAGVQASALAQTLGVPLDRAGRVRVAPDLTIPGHANVFVVGDLAAVGQDGALVPGVAPAAMQEGEHTAQNIKRAIQGRALMPFRYRDRGSFATIGRGAAVGVILDRFRFSGVFAWIAWLLIHIFFLIGFRHRLMVLLQWAYQYLTYRRGVRLITGDSSLRSRD